MDDKKDHKVKKMVKKFTLPINTWIMLIGFVFAVSFVAMLLALSPFL